MTRPVVVLAGGKGTRVAHLTGSSMPKAMLPIGGRPFIDLKLEGLSGQGVREVYLMTGHAGEPLERHVGDGNQYWELEVPSPPPSTSCPNHSG